MDKEWRTWSILSSVMGGGDGPVERVSDGSALDSRDQAVGPAGIPVELPGRQRAPWDEDSGLRSQPQARVWEVVLFSLLAAGARTLLGLPRGTESSELQSRDVFMRESEKRL